jgi:ADP-ribose pyrophosphatase
MNPDDVKIAKKETSFQGYFRVDRYHLKHRLFEGGWSAEFTREVFERGHAACVVLYDADLDQVVLVEQFRIGAYAALSSPWWDDRASPWLVELVAGIIDEGETPEGVIRRETLEEAGCAVGEMVPVVKYLVSPGGSSETMYIFCGQVDAATADGVHGMTEEHENIRVITMPTEEVFRRLDEGRINNSMTIIGLQWLRQHHTELRARWRKSS